MIRGGVLEPKRTASDLWVGLLDSGDGGIRVRRFESNGEAAQAVKDATDIDAEAADQYAVLGPLKGTSAREAVMTVADCLKNG
jgi:hypothetical protein